MGKIFSSTNAPKTPLSPHVKQGESGLFPTHSGGMFTFGHAQSLAKVAKVHFRPLVGEKTWKKNLTNFFFYVFLLVFYISELRIRIKRPKSTKIVKKRPKMYLNALLHANMVSLNRIFGAFVEEKIFPN